MALVSDHWTWLQSKLEAATSKRRVTIFNPRAVDQFTMERGQIGRGRHSVGSELLEISWVVEFSSRLNEQDSALLDTILQALPIAKDTNGIWIDPVISVNESADKDHWVTSLGIITKSVYGALP